jgi:chemotaxis protein MotA
MLLLIGFIIVIGSTLGGFMIAGGHPGVLLHVSEFVTIGGVALGILVIASPLGNATPETIDRLMRRWMATMDAVGD